MNEQAIRDAITDGCPFGGYGSVSQVEDAERFASSMTVGRNGRAEYLQSAMNDWYKGRLLELYILSVL